MNADLAIETLIAWGRGNATTEEYEAAKRLLRAMGTAPEQPKCVDDWACMMPGDCSKRGYCLADLLDTAHALSGGALRERGAGVGDVAVQSSPAAANAPTPLLNTSGQSGPLPLTAPEHEKLIEAVASALRTVESHKREGQTPAVDPAAVEVWNARGACILHDEVAPLLTSCRTALASVPVEQRDILDAKRYRPITGAGSPAY